MNRFNEIALFFVGLSLGVFFCWSFMDTKMIRYKEKVIDYQNKVFNNAFDSTLTQHFNSPSYHYYSGYMEGASNCLDYLLKH